MKFTSQLTASNVGLDYGIVKQVVFDVPDATAAYKKHDDIIGEYLGNHKTKNGFAGCFIGHSLKLYDGGDFSFEMTKDDFKKGEDTYKLDVVGWYDEDGKFHVGDPKKKTAN